MPIEFDASRFLDQYRAEIRERLDRASSVLMAMEADADPDSLAQLVREFHTIKGAAAMMGFPRMAQLAHELEDVASSARSDVGALTPDQINRMLREVDELRRLLEDSTDIGRSAGDSAEREPAGFGADSQFMRVSTSSLGHVARRASEMLNSRGLVNELTDRLSECWRLAVEQCERWQQVQEQVEYLERLHAGRPGTSIEGVLGMSVGLSRLRLDLERAFDKYIDLIDRWMIAASDIYTESVAMQMVDVSAIGVYLHRAVRDIAERQGKKIDFRFYATDTKISRPVLRELTESLLHLVRNAADHGIEDTDTRIAAGKPETATISLKAVSEGGHVRFVLEDDGRGFDIAAIERRARALGILKEGVEALSKARLEALVLADGFTTKEATDEFSGRGVGLGIARKKIESVGGTIELQSTSADGTRFVIVIPSSAFLQRTLVCEVGESLICIPASCVRSVARSSQAEWFTLEGRRMVRLGGNSYPLLAIPGLKGLARGASGRGDLVTVSALGRTFVILVDRVIDESEVLVKPLGALFRRITAFAGATILGEGRIALVVSMSALAGGVDALPFEGLVKDLHQDYGVRAYRPSRERARRVLVVDDSVTSRELLRSVLESEGLETTGAIDGIDALQKLQSSDFDLVVTDVEMPGIDGISLCRRIREGDRQYRDIPVVIVTTRASAEDRRRGLEVGADAYVVKKEFDQVSLIETVHQLICRDDRTT